MMSYSKKIKSNETKSLVIFVFLSEYSGKFRCGFQVTSGGRVEFPYPELSLLSSFLSTLSSTILLMCSSHSIVAAFLLGSKDHV